MVTSTAQDSLLRLGRLVTDESHFQESDDEYDIHEAAWKNGVIKRQWAETTVTGLRNPGEDGQ